MYSTNTNPSCPITSKEPKLVSVVVEIALVGDHMYTNMNSSSSRDYPNCEIHHIMHNQPELFLAPLSRIKCA